MTGQRHSTPPNGELREDSGRLSFSGTVCGPTNRSQTKAFPLTAADRTVSVIIACYDMQRMSLLLRAIHSVCSQDYPNKVTVVVDHNEELYTRLFGSLPDTVSVIRNTRARSAGGARNTAALKEDRSLLAFLDDDAIARPGWLKSLVQAIEQPGVVGAGGRILPSWQKDCPRWFPPELGWVVGASIVKDEARIFPVRNVWSGNMMVYREAFQAVSGFREDLTKRGGASQPEDTELCLRLSHAYGADGQWLMVPSALVEHHVPAHRATLRYVVDRCWSEGTGKVRMCAMSADRGQALADEKVYLSRTIPRAVGVGVLESFRRRNLDGLMRSGTILLGVGAAMLGAAIATISMAFAKVNRKMKMSGIAAVFR